MSQKKVVAQNDFPSLIHQSGKRIPLESHLIIGRSVGNIIIKSDTQLSSEHARFDFIDGNVYITDLGSTNGVFINDHIITTKEKTVVPNKAQVKIGSQTFTLDFPEAEVGNVSAVTTIAPLKLIKANGLVQSPQEKIMLKQVKKPSTTLTTSKPQVKNHKSRLKKLLSLFTLRK